MHLRLLANPALRHCFAVLPVAYADRLLAESATAVRDPTEIQSKTIPFICLSDQPHIPFFVAGRHRAGAPLGVPRAGQRAPGLPVVERGARGGEAVSLA